MRGKKDMKCNTKRLLVCESKIKLAKIINGWVDFLKELNC